MRLPPIRDSLRRLVGSGWGRLFLVAWVALIALTGSRLIDQGYAESHFSYTAGKWNDERRARVALPEGSPGSEREGYSERKAREDYEAAREGLRAYRDTEENFGLALVGFPLASLVALWIARGFKRREAQPSGKA